MSQELLDEEEFLSFDYSPPLSKVNETDAVLEDYSSDSNLNWNVASDEEDGSGPSNEQDRTTLSSSATVQVIGSLHKAGLESVNVNAISRKIEDLSKGSKFSNFQEKQMKRWKEQAKVLKAKLNKELLKDGKPTRLYYETLDAVDAYLDELKLEDSSTPSRVIIHIDMDAFYAAVEMRDQPHLKTVPMAVGGHSMLCTANYEARKHGVTSAMPGYLAKKICPQLVIVPVNFEKYEQVSNQIQSIFEEYDSDFRAMSLDEAFLDLTPYMHEHGLTDVEALVSEIRDRIVKTTLVTASAGISCNTLLAKLCSNVNKPNGQFYLPPDPHEILTFINKVPIRKVNGVGKALAFLLLDVLSISNIHDVYEKRAYIKHLFSELQFQFLMRVCLGIGSKVVKSEYQRKSIGVERTFTSKSKLEDLLETVRHIATHLVDDMKSHKVLGRTLSLKWKTVNFDVHTKSVSLKTATDSLQEIQKQAEAMIHELYPLNIRLMGLRMSKLEEATEDVNHAKRRKTGILKFFNRPAQIKVENDTHGNELICILSDEECDSS